MFLYQHVYLTASLGGGGRQWGERRVVGGWFWRSSSSPFAAHPPVWHSHSSRVVFWSQVGMNQWTDTVWPPSVVSSLCLPGRAIFSPITSTAVVGKSRGKSCWFFSSCGPFADKIYSSYGKLGLRRSSYSPFYLFQKTPYAVTRVVVLKVLGANVGMKWAGRTVNTWELPEETHEFCTGLPWRVTFKKRWRFVIYPRKERWNCQVRDLLLLLLQQKKTTGLLDKIVQIYSYRHGGEQTPAPYLSSTSMTYVSWSSCIRRL